MLFGLSVHLGLPWWVVTVIACGVVVVAVVVFVLVRDRAFRSVAALLAVEGAVIASVAPFVMSDMHSNRSAMASGGGSMSSHSSAVIHVIEHAQPAHMKQMGNLVTFANPIFDSADAKRIGHDQGICMHIALAKSSECVWTTVLPGGQITAEGPEPDTGNMTPFAITGGTGKYANARGWLEEKAHNKAGTEFDIVFHVSG